MIWLNGEFRDDAAAVLSWHDPGFVSGATVVDNCRTWAGKLFRWADHLARLRNDCEACFIPLPFDDKLLTAAAAGLIDGLKDDVHVITFVTPETVGMHLKPVDHTRNQRFYRDGVRLEFVGYQAVSEDHFIVPPRSKHRSRMMWHIANAKARAIHSDALALLQDVPVGSFTETSLGNILAVIDGCIRIPPQAMVLSSIGLRTTLEFCAGRGWTVDEWQPLNLQHVEDLSELMLTGSGFGLCGVSSVIGRTLPCPGPVTRQLMADWEQALGCRLS